METKILIKLFSYIKQDLRMKLETQKNDSGSNQSSGDKVKKMCSDIVDEVKGVCSDVSDNTCGKHRALVPQVTR